MMTTPEPASQLRAIEVLLPCDEMDSNLEFFQARLGMRIESIWPADDPREAVLSGHGLRVRLRRNPRAASTTGAATVPPVDQAYATPSLPTLLLRVDDPAAIGPGPWIAPNGTRIELVAAEPPLQLPPLRPTFVISRTSDSGQWHLGRAGMRYRDLLPDRQGGRFIASHIRIPEGGPVPDYVHYHKVHFQMIYCHRGWVQVVYEDQGPPFRMEAGDCVLQPPEIRHRVLESSAGLEVVEIGCPAEHETLAEYELSLPTLAVQPERSFAGQRFLRFRAAEANWNPGSQSGFEYADLGLARATGGVADGRVHRRGSAGPVEEATAAAVSSAPAAGIRATGDTAAIPAADGSGGLSGRHEADLCFLFIRAGELTLILEGEGEHRLAAGDAVAIPRGKPFRLVDGSSALEWLEVVLPAPGVRT